ncbi:hypothetical protein RJ640_007419 [Escallonia rubra]|uniref:Uncharacterized protein n=1 Tax=Escallonia rubra TaxID=112253 RepID=A0AA88UNC9_9ASTE|nr:hypothetical protein RJ640_007419 [Escallonia rubra]
MALSSSFRERLEHMEQTRNQRLSLLQAEKEVQANKYQVLQSKLSSVRLIERRCLRLDHKIASQHVVVSSLMAEIDRLSYGYAAVLQQFRFVQPICRQICVHEKISLRDCLLMVCSCKELSIAIAKSKNWGMCVRVYVSGYKLT